MAQSSEITDNIVQTVANHEDSSPDDLPPLADKVDAETYHKLAASDGQLDEPLEFSNISGMTSPYCRMGRSPFNPEEIADPSRRFPS